MKDLNGWKEHAQKRGYTVHKLRRLGFHPTWVARFHGKQVGRFVEGFGGSLMSRNEANKVLGAFARGFRGIRVLRPGRSR